jgi:hypothetical protein
MKTEELIERVNALNIESDFNLTEGLIRKLVFDGVITAAPRDVRVTVASGRRKRSVPLRTESGSKMRVTSQLKMKGRPPSNWPEETVAEIAAYLTVQNMLVDRVGVRIPKETIKDIRLFSRTLKSNPQEWCPVFIDEDGDIDFEPKHDYVKFVLRRGLRITDEVDSKYKSEYDMDIRRDSLFESAEEFLNHLLSRKEGEPDLFNEDESYDLYDLSESITDFRRSYGVSYNPNNEVEFTVIPEVSKWLVTYEKVLNNRPLADPLRVLYGWIVDIKHKTGAEPAYRLDTVVLRSSYLGSPVRADQVSVRYHVNIDHENGGLSRIESI